MTHSPLRVATTTPAAFSTRATTSGPVRARTAEPLVPDLTSWPNPGRYSTWRTARAAAGTGS